VEAVYVSVLKIASLGKMAKEAWPVLNYCFYHLLISKRGLRRPGYAVDEEVRGWARI
jgi:hypothetical protein